MYQGGFEGGLFISTNISLSDYHENLAPTFNPNDQSYSSIYRPKRFTLKAYKRGWLSCRDGVLRIHSSRDAASKGEPPSFSVELRGAEVAYWCHNIIYRVRGVEVTYKAIDLFPNR